MARPSGIKRATESEHVRLAVHSDPGKGKTRLVGSSSEMGPTLILRPPFEHLDSILPADKKRVETWVIPDWDEMDQALDYLRHDGKEWEWVWLDSISLWQDAGLDDIWDTVIAEKPARARYGLDKQEYNINMTRLARWVRHVVGPDLFNFGVTAHSEHTFSPDKDEDGDPIEKLMPWVQGKQMPNKICGYMNMVAYLTSTGDEDPQPRVLHTSSTDVYYAKNQFAKDGKDWKIKDPTIPKVMAKVEEARGAKSKSARTRKAGSKAGTSNKSGAKKRRTNRR